MAKFVHDVKTRRWVVIAPSRVSRPHDNLPSPPRPGDASCPFEPENDPLNEEVFRIGPATAGWQVRVIKNKYPVTDIHEVIIHSPDHEKDIDELPIEQVELILQTYRQRYNYHLSTGHGQVLIFDNHDVHAGASISHPHSQLVVVPEGIELETIPKEPIENTVVTSSRFTVYCPNFSQWPYEVWVAPRLSDFSSRFSGSSQSVVGLSETDKQKTGKLGSDNGQQRTDNRTFGTITDEEIADLAVLLQKVLRFIVQKFSQAGQMHQAGSDRDVPYNYYIYHGKDWYLRIIPRLIHRAGLELGTGLSVNIVDPAQAAREYKEGLGSISRVE